MKRKYYPALLILLLVYSCEVTEIKNDGIDSDLIGSWYNIQIHSGRVGPDESVSGIQINDDGSMYILAVKYSTGQLTRLYYFGNIDKAYYNQMEFTRYINIIGLGPEYKKYAAIYSVEKNTLSINPEPLQNFFPLQKFYQGSYLGAVVTEPVENFFTIDSDIYNTNYIFKNDSVSFVPSAYAYWNNDDLVLIARCGDSDFK